MLSFSYKKTNIDFIGDIPMHWNIVKLKLLSDIINGFAFSSQDFSAYQEQLEVFFLFH